MDALAQMGSRKRLRSLTAGTTAQATRSSMISIAPAAAARA
jgi:hypothetical protein